MTTRNPFVHIYTYTSIFLKLFVRESVNVRKYLIVRRVELGPEKEKSIIRVLS